MSRKQALLYVDKLLFGSNWLRLFHCLDSRSFKFITRSLQIGWTRCSQPNWYTMLQQGLTPVLVRYIWCCQYAIWQPRSQTRKTYPLKRIPARREMLVLL